MPTSWRRWPVVDEVRVTRLLRHADQALTRLLAEQDAPAERRADPLWLDGVKYLMVACIERCIDIAQHACSSDRLGLPRDNGDAMRLLGQQGYLSEELATAMTRAIGFRNVLVHDYIDTDDAIVLARLADLRDLQAFISQASAWLAPAPDVRAD